MIEYIVLYTYWKIDTMVIIKGINNLNINYFDTIKYMNISNTKGIFLMDASRCFLHLMLSKYILSSRSKLSKPYKNLEVSYII